MVKTAHVGFADILSLLRCTACGSSLELLQQSYHCMACGEEFPIVRGVARFVDANNYAETFGYQWQQFARTQLMPEASELNFRKKTGLRVEDLEGKLVLDVGCGMGRFAEVATRWGARVIGIDLSAASEVAARNLADRNFVALQADLFNLPFAPESFDCIYSVGVLHHTPDCEKAFKNLPQYLRPGGSIAVWLYSGYNKWYRFSDYYRRLTHRIPIQKMHAILRIAVPALYGFDRGVRRIPWAGPPISGLVRHVFPVSRSSNPEIRLLDTLDWYTPKYQSKHTYEQVFRWFESCGLENLRVGDISIGVRGQKPGYSLESLSEMSRTPQPEFVNPRNDETASSLQLQKTPTRYSVGRGLTRTVRWLPSYIWQRATRRTFAGPTHLIIAMADHFEPAITPNWGPIRAAKDVQEKRLEEWCREYSKAFSSYRDHDGFPFIHTYFYPAEQYDADLLARLASFCHAGWGEIEIHLHHGAQAPDTAENTRRTLLEFRDALAFQYGCLSYCEGKGSPQYAFVHGNFALANSAGGRNCGVDSELQVLSETGCYADLTLPPGPRYSSHIAKINSLYECSLPLERRAAHREGRCLQVDQPPHVFPLIIEGPLMLSFSDLDGKSRFRVEHGGVSAKNPPSLRRLRLWKQASITVRGRPNWLFIKLHCHGMDPRDKDVMLGESICNFISQLIEGSQQRSETIHFVSAQEMVNIILAACDGREGNPGDYRDYRLKRFKNPMVRSTEQVANGILMGR